MPSYDWLGWATKHRTQVRYGIVNVTVTSESVDRTERLTGRSAEAHTSWWSSLRNILQNNRNVFKYYLHRPASQVCTEREICPVLNTKYCRENHKLRLAESNLFRRNQVLICLLKTAQPFAYSLANRAHSLWPKLRLPTDRTQSCTHDDVDKGLSCCP